jgi:hypothetical protein
MQPTEDVYKRQVYSGKSNSISYGRRLNFGSRSYYSVKSVCAECATTLDEQSSTQSKTFITIIFIVAIAILLFVLFK